MAIFVMNSQKITAEGFEDIIEVVINADANGKATGVHEFVNAEDETKTDLRQYVASRDIRISVYFDEDVTNTFNKYTVCEVIPENTENNTTEKRFCSDYEIRIEKVKLVSGENEVEKFLTGGLFQIRGANDGEKNLEILFSSVGGSLTIKKSIILDTIAPIINLTGGEYIYIASGEQYSEPGYACEDTSDVVNGECSVEVDGEDIDVNKPGYQYIMYTAKDFLGNETNVTRKVMVEAKKEEGGISFYWIIAGMILLVVGAGLTYIVIKNKEKQRNQSVL